LVVVSVFVCTRVQSKLSSLKCIFISSETLNSAHSVARTSTYDCDAGGSADDVLLMPVSGMSCH